MRKVIFSLLALFLGLFALSCGVTTTTSVESSITLVDLAGKTQAEIIALYEEQDLSITFREIQTAEVAAGLFIRYVGYSVGVQVPAGTSIRIEIAVGVPSAPIITGATDTFVYIAVADNPPTFDLWEGISAEDYLGNDIPQGNFFYILSIQDEGANPLANINYYVLGTYTVTYVAQNSGLSTTVVRTIEIIVPPFDTSATDDLRLTASYAGKSFIADGIGEVTVTTYTDGDTTNFRDVVSGEYFTVRYLGIDAPEATSKYEPWGIKAGTFAREILQNADKIILQAEGERMDGNGRYLAWVWYEIDGVTRLLNLELVETAYAWTSGATTTQYATVFTIAAAETQLTGRRIYGEEDPDYDYSTEGTPIEIGVLIDNFATYVARKVTITGIITSKVGNSVFIEQSGRGIYVYAGYNLTNELQIGYEVTIQGLVPAEYYSSKQLSNYSYDNMQLLSIDNPVTVTTILGDQIGNYVGRVVRFENLEITAIDVSTSSIAYTVTAMDADSNLINIRVDAYTASFLPNYNFVVGEYIAIFGPVTQFYATYQLMLPGTGNIEFK